MTVQPLPQLLPAAHYHLRCTRQPKGNCRTLTPLPEAVHCERGLLPLALCFSLTAALCAAAAVLVPLRAAGEETDHCPEATSLPALPAPPGRAQQLLQPQPSPEASAPPECLALTL